MPDDSISKESENISRIRTVRFATEAYKYAFTCFYKAGFLWWILTAFYF